MSQYNTKDIFLERRTANNTFEEAPLHVYPNSIIVSDINGNLVMVDTSSFIAGTGSIKQADSASIAETASYAHTASYAANIPDTASIALALNPGANIYLSQSYIFSNTESVAPSHLEGQMWWDSISHTYAIDTFQSRLQIGQENYIRVFAGEKLPNGTAVYLRGAQTDPHDPNSKLPVAWLALADGTGLSASVVGLSTQDLNVGGEGLITTQGIVNGLDTQTPDFSDGDTVYLSNTQSGSLINALPPDPCEKVIIGTALYRHPSIGRILVQLSVLPPLTAPFVGLITTASFTDNGDSTCTIGQAQVNFCVTADGLGQIKSYSIPSATLSCSVGTFTQYVMAHWNSGSPEYMISPDNTMIDEIQVVSAFTVIQAFSGSGIAAVDWDAPGTLLANKLLLKSEDIGGVQRATGLILGVSGSYITITSGSTWWGVKNKICPEVNTVNTASSPLLFYYHSQSAWKASTATDGKFINSVVDDRVNQLPIPYGNYVVNYVYRGLGTLNRTLVIVSDAMDNLTEAQIFAPPAPPSYFNELNTLVGRIIVQSGSWVPTSVDSAFLSTLPLTITPQHNDLLNIQGGSGSALAGEFYHLSATEYSGSGTGLFVRQSGSIITGSISNAITASYAVNTPASISSSHAVQSDSASYLIPGNPLHLSNSYIQSSPSMSAPPWKEGRLFWDKVNHTYALYNDVSDVTLQLGQENYVHVIAGENIANARAVYIDGPMPDVDNPTNWMPKVYRALADTSTTPGIDRVAGLTTHTFTSGSSGWVTTNGVIHDVDTSTFTPGAILYLSPTVLGGYQEANPGQPYSTVEIGTVIQSDVNGSILVNPVVIPPSSNAYAGMTTVPYIDGTLNNGTVIVSTGSVNLYDNPSGIGAVTSYNIPETTLTLVSGSANYITARVSSSLVEGEYFLTTDATYANGISIVRVAQLDIYNADTSSWDVHQFNVGIVGLALSNRLNNKDIKLYGFQRQDGLTLYTTGSNGQFGITEGNVWYGPNSHLVDTFDTTLPGYYTYIFHTSGSGWHQHTSSIYLNGVYDNGAGSSSLTLVPETSWSVNFVYRIIGTTDECTIVMSNNWYSTPLEASNNAATPSNLPSTIRDQCLLVGRFIVQSGSYASTQIESAFSNIFLPTIVTDHESLLGLQGSTIGAGSGHYHLKSDDYTGTGTGVIVRTDKPSFAGATVGHVPYWNSQQQLTLTGSIQISSDKYVVINSASSGDPSNREALLVRQVDSSSVNVIGAYADTNNFSQIYNQNLSNGATASTDFVATSDVGGQYSNYIDMGINSSGFVGAASPWPWGGPSEGYILMDSASLWLAIATDHALKFAFNNTASTNYADKTGFYLSGSFYGTSSWTNNAFSASITKTINPSITITGLGSSDWYNYGYDESDGYGSIHLLSINNTSITIYPDLGGQYNSDLFSTAGDFEIWDTGTSSLNGVWVGLSKSAPSDTLEVAYSEPGYNPSSGSSSPLYHTWSILIEPNSTVVLQSLTDGIYSDYPAPWLVAGHIKARQISASSLILTSPYSTALQVGTSLPIYLSPSWPTLAFNSYWDSTWKFGPGTSGQWGAWESLDVTTGKIDFYFPPAAGNAGGAWASVDRVFSIPHDGMVQMPLLPNGVLILSGSSRQVTSSADLTPFNTSASYAISASYVPNLYTQSYQESGSWASASLSASHAVSASYAPNLYTQDTVASASWVSASAFITTAQTASYVTASNVVGTVTSASYAISASYLLDYAPTISASWASSSISASHAITASYVLGVPTIKSGIVAGTLFGGTTSKTSSIAFANSFTDNNYTVVVTGESSRAWTIQNKVSGGFDINANSTVVFTDNVFWQAISTGEFYS